MSTHEQLERAWNRTRVISLLTIPVSILCIIASQLVWLIPESKGILLFSGVMSILTLCFIVACVVSYAQSRAIQRRLPD